MRCIETYVLIDAFLLFIEQQMTGIVLTFVA